MLTMWSQLQVKLQHLVTLHIKSSAFGSKLDAGMFMKALSLQYDVWAENQYQHLLSVSRILPETVTNLSHQLCLAES